MNYTQYLQIGGELAQPEAGKTLGKEEVSALVQTILKGDDLTAQQAAQLLVEAYKADPENGWINDYLAGAQEAAKNGNQDAARFVLIVFPLLEQAQSMKCGGKVRAKIKKACGGKKMEKGGETPVKKMKSGCPCTTLKKVGGRLIEVDCNGIPIAKEGTKITKFLAPSGAIHSAYNSNNPRSDFQGADNLGDFDYYIDRTGRNKLYARRKEDGKIYMAKNVFSSMFGKRPDTFEKWNELTGDDYNNALNVFNELANQNRKDSERPATTTPETTSQTPPTKTAGQLMFERGLTPNTLSDYSLQGRQNWINSAENQAYLEANGWDANRRAAYKGSAVDNRELLKLIQGRAKWNPTLVDPNSIENSRINQKTGQINEGWRGMSDQDLINYKGRMFDLSDEELQRRAHLLSGTRQAIANNTVRNGDEYYVNGQWVDFDNMQGVTGKSLPGQTQNQKLFVPRRSLALPQDYAASFRKQGGCLNYAQYLNLK